MSEDINNKVQQIAKILGQDDLPDNVKELVALIASSIAANEEKTDQAESHDDAGKERPQPEPAAINPDVLDTARNVLDRFNAANDPRINLLQAIKPFMNKRRQAKIGSCIQLLKVAGLSRMLGEQEK
ncbi:MAG: hypothetical protein ACOX4M_03210 [Acetivibrionales bacterium]|jgi:transcriptional regulator with AAA-type ATPase domain